MVETEFAGWKYKNEFRAYLSRDEEENGLYFADFNENLKLREVIVAALSEPALDCTLSRVLFPRVKIWRQEVLATDPKRVPSGSGVVPESKNKHFAAVM